jgi:hypothetical protein
MHATWSIALAADSPVLVVPWHDDAGRVAYVDLRACPDCIEKISEVRENPPLASLLVALNAPDSPWATAKCDRWTLDEDDLEAASFDLALARDRKSVQVGIGSYIDFYHRAEIEFTSLEHHRELLQRLTRAAERPGTQQDSQPSAMLELMLRHCIADGREGYAITAFLYAIGEDAVRAQENWAASLAALQHILLSSTAPAAIE